jgi:hypothetical protein
MFVRDIDLALQRAEASHSPEIWQSMSASEARFALATHRWPGRLWANRPALTQRARSGEYRRADAA